MRRLQSAVHADCFNLIGRFAQACGIDHVNQKTIKFDRHRQRVAGCSGNIGHNRNIPRRQGIEQRRLAHIRQTDQRHGKTIPNMRGQTV